MALLVRTTPKNTIVSFEKIKSKKYAVFKKNVNGTYIYRFQR